MSEDLILAERRWADLALLQEHYINFEDLVVDVMTDVLGFTCKDGTGPTGSSKDYHYCLLCSVAYHTRSKNPHPDYQRG